jgi:hypothetical protein
MNDIKIGDIVAINKYYPIRALKDKLVKVDSVKPSHIQGYIVGASRTTHRISLIHSEYYKVE